MTSTLSLVVVPLLLGVVRSEPVFDPSTLMRLVMVPVDAAVGSVIYRVRASDSDFDYPLHFELIGQMGRLDIGIETLPCTRYNSVCQANVILLRRLEPGRYVDFRLSGSPLFAIRQRRVSTENTEGTIFLVGPLDFEAQSMNIAALEVVVVVQDIQDMPPVFTSAPPITHLPRQVSPGDLIVRVKAEDGDKGAPRPIRYGLVSEGNPFTPFFNINETTGEVTLERPIEEIAAISHAGTPILLTVVAEEVRLSREEPEAMSSTVQLAFILPEKDNSPPYFENEYYITYLDENAPQGTALTFSDPYIPQVNDNDAGKNGVFSLSLIGNNGTFEISPTVAERHAQFIIKVRDNTMLDYEARKSILAQELGPSTNLSVTTNVTVYLNDVNDNPPVFLALSYDAELPENVTAGTRVVQVQADDVDTGAFGKIQYTAILGYLNTSLNLDPISGLITVATNNHGFDREAMPELHFLVEARDNDGVGLRVTVPLIIKLLDVNDNPPEFERTLYEFVLSPNLDNFTSAAFVKAIDKDAEPPNNLIRYEIIEGNREQQFAINEETGEIYIKEPLKKNKVQNKFRQKRQEDSDESEVYILTIRAYDLGVPRLTSTTTVKIYPPESKTRTMSFIVPGSNPDRKKLEELLSTLSGGKVNIIDIKPYKGKADESAGSDQERSEVIALVRISEKSAINVAKLQEQLARNKTIYTTGSVSNDEKSTVDNSDSSLYKAESRLLFWLLILLAVLVALVLLLLICCCICEGCPLYMPPRKRVIRVNSTEDDVHLVVRDKRAVREKSTQNLENKTMQTAEWRRREAWSAEQADLRTKPTQWKFNKRNQRSKDIKPSSTSEFVHAAEDNDYKYDDTRHSLRQRDGPNIIYTKEMQLQEAFANKHKEYIEDLDNDYDRIATLHHRKDQDNDSLRRHEIDRGSDAGIANKSEIAKNSEEKDESSKKIGDNQKHASSSHGRDQYYIKEGNTEILRLVTRGHNEEERYVNFPIHQQRPVTLIPKTQYVVIDNGKELLMERFIREQGEEANYMRQRMNTKVTDLDEVSLGKESKIDRSNIDAARLQEQHNSQDNVPGTVPLKSEYLQTALLEIHNKSTLNQELLESSLRKQNELLHQILIEREKIFQNQETASQVENKLETQSLPGQSAMATQTECHIGTQTEPNVFNEVKRKARSDNDSYSDDDSQNSVKDEITKPVWLKRKKPKKKIKYKDPRRSIRAYEVKRKIKTPIIEESDVSPSLESEKRVKVSKTNERLESKKCYGDITKSTVITSKNEITSSTKIKLDNDKNEKLRKEILLEISDSLDENQISNGSKHFKEEKGSGAMNRLSKLRHDKSKDSSSSMSDKSQDSKLMQDVSSSEAQENFRHQQTVKNELGKSLVFHNEQDDIIKVNKDKKEDDEHKANDSKIPQKSLPRYMQWYSKKTTDSKLPADKSAPDKPKRPSKIKSGIEPNDEKSGRYGKIAPKVTHDNLETKKNFKVKESEFIHPRILKEGKVTPVPEGPMPDAHPLLQHSEHRYEHKYENQNPLCHIQPTHIPKYLKNDSNIPVLPKRQSIEQQPIYVNQEEVKRKQNLQAISESALTHSISISTNYEKDRKSASEVHVSKISIGGDNANLNKTAASKLDDDDSGIAMNTLSQQTGILKRPPITEKKSVFTIAYDDVQTKQLRPDSSSTSH
ncbi:unnamed protein product [Leptidea sinapis]|uniref:Cadherin domain-containing protein n=1 Tax=Leptidea sinapis TaxID=189913 RepID=A0A5E4QY96_9NEOP|nr:unnamed protein product [Leptidea sinapis]